MEKADADCDGQVDLEEFLELVRSMRTGNPHEGPLAPQVIAYMTLNSSVYRAQQEGILGRGMKRVEHFLRDCSGAEAIE